VLAGQASARSPAAGSASPDRGSGGESGGQAEPAGRGGPDSGPAEPGLTPDDTTSPGKALGERRASRPVRPRRGRPRKKGADRVILVAAAEIMAEKGIAGLSIEEVAIRARVGKTTIYRRWPSRGTLALDAFLAEFPGPPPLPDTGTFAGDLRQALGGWVRAITGSSAASMLVGIIAEIQQDRALAIAWQDQIASPLRAQYSILLDRAVSRGEIPAETDAGIVLDLVFGACYYRLLQGQHSQRPLNEQFVNQIVDVIAAGVGAGPH
jgi:AcrR family transcriptional regulator